MRTSNILIVSAIAALTILAWSNRFIQDDAFISFRYADNLVHGKGLVWNEGERVEGYTNFLWTLMMTAPLALHIDPVPFSYTLGIVCFILTLVFTFLCTTIVSGSRKLALLTVVLLGTNYSFNAYATGGLETQLQAFLFVTCFYLALRSFRRKEWTIRSLLGLSLLLTASVLTRPDSMILVIVLAPVVLFSLLKSDTGIKIHRAGIIPLVLPFIIVVGGWFLWKLSYYGDIFPNSYYLKFHSSYSLRRGLHYLYSFLYSYWLFPHLAIGIIAIRALSKKVNPAIGMFLAVIIFWSLYVIRVNGDFMEYRLLVPVLPLAFIIVTWLIANAIPHLPVQAALIGLVLAGSLHHALTFENSGIRWGITPIRQLHAQVAGPEQNWAEIGKVLGNTFSDGPDIMVATTASGAIPFYSRLRAIDMLGMNDRWVARHGEILSNRPGHQRIAPLPYLIERGVNLVIAHPWIIIEDTHRPSGRYYRLQDLEKLAIRDTGLIPEEAKILEIPITTTRILVTLYLTQSPLIDNTITQNNWKVYSMFPVK